MNAVHATDLRHGDVLLFHGAGLLSRFIRLFDGSQYSHAAIFDGQNVVEAEPESGNGICVDSVEKAYASGSFVHVYRFMSNDGKRFNGDLPYAPIGATIEYFKRTPEAYAYSQILLLGVLLATRRVPVPGIAPILRHFLDEAAEKLNDWLNVGRKVIICSELVYKCFYDVGDPRYALEVSGVDPSVVSLGLQSRTTLMPSITPDADTAHLQKDAAAFLATYKLAKPGLSLALSGGPSGDVMAAPEFVTPRDLATSPNLLLIGQLAP